MAGDLDTVVVAVRIDGLRHPGQVITRAMLLREVWRYHFSIETNVVDVHISNLRKKIDVRGVPSLIVNIRGAGVMLNANA